MTDENTQPQGGEQPAEGLLDSISLESNEPVDTNKSEISHLQEPEDDSPLERPDWWPENFWKKDDSEPDLEAIAKSWTDLRKQISQGKHKAPEDGNYDFSAFGETPADDPVRQHVSGWAKEFGVSQVALDALVGGVIEKAGAVQQQAKFDAAAEKKALGPNADAIIKGLTKLREAYEGRIPTQSAPIDGAPSKDELMGMVADPRYKTDAAYRTKVERMFNQAFN